MIICLICSFALPAQAATLSELALKVQELQKMLDTYKMTLSGQVISTPLAAGVGTTITVSNDQQLLDALKSVTGGETIALQPGTYSPVTIDPTWYNLRVGSLMSPGNATNLSSLSAPVTITSADPNNRATMTTLRFYNGAGNFRIENISFRPQTDSIAVDLTGDNFTFTRNDISYGDSTNWTAAEWDAKTGYAVSANGSNIEISYNYIKNVDFGIVGGRNSYVHHNKIENFIGDGMRGEDNSKFEHNIVLNPYFVNDNHTDGFQSFASPDELNSIKLFFLSTSAMRCEGSISTFL